MQDQKKKHFQISLKIFIFFPNAPSWIKKIMQRLHNMSIKQKFSTLKAKSRKTIIQRTKSLF